MPIAEAILAGVVVNGLTRLATALGPKVTSWRASENIARDVKTVDALSSAIRDAAASLDAGPLAGDPRLDELLQESDDIVADIFEAYRLDPDEQLAKLDEVCAAFQVRLRGEFGDLDEADANVAARTIFDRLSDLAAKLCGASIQTGALPADELRVPGAPAAPEPDMEVGHFLFMDIVGFSRESNTRQQALHETLTAIVHSTEAYTHAVAHDRLVALPTGDGMVLAFLRTVQAPVRCAVEIADKIRANHPDVQLRMGVHQGPVYHTVDINKAGNVTGDGINIAQRVMDCGDAGHILVSADAAAVLLRLDEWENDLHDIGEFEVKHGERLQLYNLYRDDVGNRATPARHAPVLTDRLASIPPPMLRIEHRPDDAALALALVEANGTRETANVSFGFVMQEKDERDMAWYLEEYLGNPYDPAPQRARVVENRMREMGAELFDAVFEGSEEAEGIWATLRGRLHGARIEISEPSTGGRVPWELMRQPDRDEPLSLRVASFARSAGAPAQVPGAPEVLLAANEQVRILLVTCRPGGARDVPYRSVAVRLLRNVEASGNVRLDVLRPPTFEALSDTLRAAHTRGEPFHVVHFDGHGTHTDLHDLFEQWEEMAREALDRHVEDTAGTANPRRYTPGSLHLFYPHTARPGNRGYLVFENAGVNAIPRMVDGDELGALLHGAGVPILILNACRSDRSDGASASDAVGSGEGDAEALVSQEQPYAFSSFAQEVLRLGVSGIVAMRHSVLVETAVEFVEDLYNHLLGGSTLGDAASQGRKGLRDHPLRDALDQRRPLQDWSVPVVYEQTPLALRPPVASGHGPPKLIITTPTEGDTPSSIDAALPGAPDLGFIGRDATLLALDRAFDAHSVVLLHGDAGKGKTTAVAEFARWYSKTHGIDGPILFSSFERYLPLERVLDKFGEVFASSLEASGVPWQTVTGEGQRRALALQVLGQIPVLWVWDNVEPVTGFPRNTESAWTEEEQAALRSFLHEASAAGTKFLLTSRRPERWLGDLTHRIGIPRMPMRDRAALLRQLASRRGSPVEDIKRWRPLLDFSDGNPLALRVSAGLAIEARCDSEEDVTKFVGRLRAGEVDIGGDEAEGRSHSLAVSLRYGFEEAFTEEEHPRLALLHLFQGVVNTQILRIMSDPEDADHIPKVAGVSEAEWVELLDRAEEVGLLTQTAKAGDSIFYRLHPALPWYFRQRFLTAYGDPDANDARALHAVRSYVEAVGALGEHLHNAYADGRQDMLVGMRLEEENLLHVRWLARKHGWWRPVIGAMQGVMGLYALAGRHAEWRRLVEETTPHFFDGETDGPAAGLEEEWSLVAEYRVRILREDRHWESAERLQRLVVEWDRARARPFLDQEPATLSDPHQHRLAGYATSLAGLARIQYERGSAECIAGFKDAYSIHMKLGSRNAAATAANTLGVAYLNIESIRDLDEAAR
ncbi:CHAT domain-containing protein, partial [Candidatus Poribacteria bacterium]|nr:CHAT domain-containing protein [Candidatus Poribacteria bacterium]